MNKFCVDCKWAKINDKNSYIFETVEREIKNHLTCNHPSIVGEESIEFFVYGTRSPSQRKCTEIRSNESLCGKEGKWWTEFIHPPLIFLKTYKRESRGIFSWLKR